ncbi:DUF6714 family protein [Lysobacter auxotrophicus]|uniref:Uncharacterized protein n=1 Tax=Lysobacter auxotrophicus TaxID=2992573 RepID=A0ABN6UPF7_9GAMM|nr:DUF6714 family protein [Lysobacter auxotrophicus]BDU18269.1 hypothetical protein LA521A_34700 [Lysobacter auxotrophicus]
MDVEQLRLHIARAFVDVIRPARENITTHRCDECDELRDALAPYAWQDVPVNVLDDHRWDMTLLSDDAKQHYLPAWMLQALDDGQWAGDYVWNLLFALNSDHRWAPARPYTKEQRQAVAHFLDFIEHRDLSEWEAQDVEKARASLRERFP